VHLMRISRHLSESTLEDDVMHPFGSSLLLCSFALFYFDFIFVVLFFFAFNTTSVIF